jgi:hypothetical protein
MVMTGKLLAGFVVAVTSFGAQISFTETADPSYTITGTPSSISVSTTPAETLSINSGTQVGSPLLNVSVLGLSVFDQTLSAQANPGDQILGALLEATSDIENISVSGSLSLKIDPKFLVNLSLSGPVLAQASLLLAVEELDPKTSQWNEISHETISLQETTSNPDTVVCTDCGVANLTLTDTSAEFRVHSRLDFSLVAAPEPNLLGLLAAMSVVVLCVQRHRRRA